MRQRLLTPLILFAITFAVTNTHLEASLAQQEEEQEESPRDDKSYSDVITSEAVTSTGLFATHMIGDDLYYEIPLNELGREMLLLTRIAKSPDGSAMVDLRSIHPSYAGTAETIAYFFGS